VVDVALALGCDVVRGGARRLIRRLAPDVLVVDDPITLDAKKWIRAGKRAGCLVVSLHDLGIGCLEADLVIDGSVTRTATATRGDTLAGPRFAVLDPSLREYETERDPSSVLIALGGGPRAELAQDIAEAIVTAAPWARVRVAGGFASITRPAHERITWVGPSRTLHDELARASVAVVGGGVTMYEACAHGTVAVGVPVVAAQRHTVAAFVARGVARGVSAMPITSAAVARECTRLLTDDAMRRHMARLGKKLIDGRGAFRAAEAVTRLRTRAGAR
jgi:spore coat polysaccharide biosynthesis predicted glycosyltransferase SpsG